MLSSTQAELYVHNIIVWRQTEAFAADAKPIALAWQPSGGHAVNTTVTTGAASATQTVGSTTGMSAGDTLFFVGAQVSRVIASITNGTVVVLTASVTTTTGEKVAKVVFCYCDFNKSFQAPDGGLGLVESDNQFTIDTFHMEASMDVQAGDVIRMTAGPEAGKFWAVRGNPTIKSLMANKLSVLGSRDPNPPNGVS